MLFAASETAVLATVKSTAIGSAQAMKNIPKIHFRKPRCLPFLAVAWPLSVKRNTAKATVLTLTSACWMGARLDSQPIRAWFC